MAKMTASATSGIQNSSRPASKARTSAKAKPPAKTARKIEKGPGRLNETRRTPSRSSTWIQIAEVAARPRPGGMISGSERGRSAPRSKRSLSDIPLMWGGKACAQSGHEDAFVAGRAHSADEPVKQPKLRRPYSLRRGVRLLPFFLPSKEGMERWGGARRLAKPPWRGLTDPAARLAQAREPLAQGPAPPRRSTADKPAHAAQT